MYKRYNRKKIRDPWSAWINLKNMFGQKSNLQNMYKYIIFVNVKSVQIRTIFYLWAHTHVVKIWKHSWG